MMVHYYKTTGIYANSDLLRVEVKYEKGNGYVAMINPCHKDAVSWGILYNKDYYNYYNTLTCMLVPCNRRSAKKEQEAYFLMKYKMNWLLEQYITMVENKGGRHIEIVGELED